MKLEKAIEIIKEHIAIDKSYRDTSKYNTDYDKFCEEQVEAMQTLLNEINKLQKDNYKLDRENQILFEANQELKTENELAKETIKNHCADMDKVNQSLVEIQNENIKLWQKNRQLIDEYFELDVKYHNTERELLARTDKLNDSIPKQIIRNKIEELNQYYKKEIYPIKYNWADIDITEFFDNQIELLKDILGDE